MITFKNVSAGYEGVTIVNNLNLSIEGPTITGIIGPNGAGKSTLIKAMVKLIDSKGQIEFDGENNQSVFKRIAYVQQKAEIDYSFPITVKECVSLGTFPSVGVFHKLNPHNWQDVKKALKAVNMEEYADRQISQLSGGQFQRVLLARCLVQQADYILLDEPFVGIDSVSEGIMLDLLRALRNEGKTILIVHHDLSKVKDYFDQVLILNRQLIAFGSTEQVYTNENLALAYGDQFFMKGA